MAVQTDFGILSDSQVPFMDFDFPPRVEKKFMNPIRVRVNYGIIPAFGAFAFLCIGAGVLLMKQDETKYAPAFLVLLGLVVIASVLLLMTVPKTRREELRMERERYSFDTSGIEAQPTYTVAHEGMELVLSADGIRVNGSFYWYNHLSPRLVTSNKFNRVWIAVQFGNDPLHALFVPLTPTLIQAVLQLPIPLDNREALEYLLENKEQAFARIYSTGMLSVPSGS